MTTRLTYTGVDVDLLGLDADIFASIGKHIITTPELPPTGGVQKWIEATGDLILVFNPDIDASQIINWPTDTALIEYVEFWLNGGTTTEPANAPFVLDDRF